MQYTTSVEKNILSERLLTIKQAGEYIKCSRWLLWHLRKSGKLSALHAGKKVLISKQELDILLQGDKSCINAQSI
jgi:excisionase family DNA binding protein